MGDRRRSPILSALTGPLAARTIPAVQPTSPSRDPAVSQASAVRTATFLMTDIEGSTRRWEEERPAMTVALETHDALLRDAVEAAGGTVVKTTGDGLLAVFDRPEAGLAAALAGQRALDGEAWPTSGPLRVRMALHSGSAEVRDEDYFGPALNRVARLMAIGHGGQVLVSAATCALVADALPADAQLIDLGEHRLRDLDRPEHVYQLAATGLRREFPALRAAGEHPTNLRPQATSFVGREREQADLGRLLATSRLVTLVGVGGTGKTRLELQVAGEALERYRDGAWLVELAPLSDPELVDGEIGRTLGVQPQPGRAPIESVLDYLRAKELLLLLDNCEHLIEAAATSAERLLGGCPTVRLLASSREPLGVEGEVVFAVPSLALPPAEHGAVPSAADDAAAAEAELAAVADAEAVRLFVDRARATLPDFTLDASNVRAVVEICRRLDGIPLALELAAARVNVLSPAEIAQGLNDRFRLLTGGRRTAVPRQRTLQGLIDWSWDLLDEPDQRLLRRLAVFAGGWTLDAAAAVTADEEAAPDGAVPPAARLATLDSLSRLVDRSLVVVEHAGATRYRMLETIRQYAADKLAASGETIAIRDRHLALLRQLAHDAEPGLEGPDMLAWLERLDTELDNVRAALDWAFESDPMAALEMCVGLGPYWRSRLIGGEGVDRMAQAAALARRWAAEGATSTAGEQAALAARVLARSAQFQASFTGRPIDPAFEEEAIAMARASGDPDVLADVQVALAFAAVAVDGSIPPSGPAADAAKKALELAEERGAWYWVSILAAGFAIGALATDPTATEAWLDRGTEAAQRSGNPFALGNIIGVRGRAASMAARWPEAERLVSEGRVYYTAMGDHAFERILASEGAHALRRQGRLDEAETEYRQTIRQWQESGNRGAVANQLESFAFLAEARGQGERAARLFGAAEALRETAKASMTAFEREEYDAAVERLRQELDEGTFAAEWAEGRLLDGDAAVALALSA
jgi:predicted ATPase/class 3 adenylate cyclase